MGDEGGKGMIDLSKLKAFEYEKEYRLKRYEQEQSHDQQGFDSGLWRGQLRGIKQ